MSFDFILFGIPMLISIVTTCYNSVTTIDDTIKSILGQKGDFELEYIITDAGSQDGTLDIIRKYGDAIRLIDATGSNQSKGINIGLRASQGDILAFLNADDLYLPGALQAVAKSFRENPESQWLVGACNIIDESGAELHPFISRYKEFLRRRYSYFLLLTENFICQPAVFWKRSAFLEIGDFSEAEQYVMDYEYWLRLGKKYQPLNIPTSLAAFRRSAQTKSNKGFVTQFKDDMRVGVSFALSTKMYAAIPIKAFNCLKTIGIYSFLYRS